MAGDTTPGGTDATGVTGEANGAGPGAEPGDGGGRAH